VQISLHCNLFYRKSAQLLRNSGGSLMKMRIAFFDGV
jgi:hypothetical protein